MNAVRVEGCRRGKVHGELRVGLPQQAILDQVGIGHSTCPGVPVRIPGHVTDCESRLREGHLFAREAVQ